MFKIEKMDLLIAIYIACLAISELMGGKTFHIMNIGTFPLNASVALFTVPLLFTINDVITEVYGRERTTSIIRAGLFAILLFLIFSLVATNLPPSMRFKATEKAYETIFGLSARISAASLTAFTIGEFIDVFVYVAIRKQFGKKNLWLRNNLSNFISQFSDTFIFMILAFYAFDKPFISNVNFLASLILPYWLLKCLMSVIETPFVYLGVNWLKKDNSSVIARSYTTKQSTQ